MSKIGCQPFLLFLYKSNMAGTIIPERTWDNYYVTFVSRQPGKRIKIPTRVFLELC